MQDSQKWYPIDDHVYKGHVQDAIDVGISLDFTLCLTLVSGPLIGKMVKNLLKIHNKIDSNMRQSGWHNANASAYADVVQGFHSLKMEVSLFAAYYFYIVAKQHLATSMAFTSSLPNSLRANSISAFDLTDTSLVSTSSKKGCPPKDKFFNKLAVSATNFFDEASNETTGPTSKIKEYHDLILHYQGCS